MSEMDKRKKFLNGYSGKELLKNHSLNEIGIWEVKGEDPNCDLGGSHIEPHIGVFDGMLKDVIDIAVNHKKFFDWGSGGSITKVQVIKVNDYRKVVEVDREIEELQRVLEERKKAREELIGE